MPPGQVRGTLTIGVILSIFRNELAIGILSAHVVPHDQDVVTVPLVDGPRRVEYLAWNEFNPSPAARAFLDAILHDHVDAATASSDASTM